MTMTSTEKYMSKRNFLHEGERKKNEREREKERKK